MAKNSIFSEDALASAYLVVGFRVLVDVSGSYLAQGRAVTARRKEAISIRVNVAGQENCFASHSIAGFENLLYENT